MLTDLQRQIRAVVAELPEGAAVALAGGSALIVTGVVRRGTEDLDFFTAHPEPVTAVLSAFETALAAAGLRVTRLQASETHARLRVQSDTDTTRVDLATDYRLMAPLRTDEGLILADPELAANKTLALFGRAEPRDYIDFEALAQRFSLTELCDLAASKDGGFTPSRLADALDYIEQHPREGFDLDDAAYRDLVAFSIATATRLRELERGLDNGGISIGDAGIRGFIAEKANEPDFAPLPEHLAGSRTDTEQPSDAPCGPRADDSSDDADASHDVVPTEENVS